MIDVSVAYAYAETRRTLCRQHDLLAWLFAASADAQGTFERQVDALSTSMGEDDELDAARCTEMRGHLDVIEAAVDVRDIYAGAVADVLNSVLRGLVAAYKASGADEFALTPQRYGFPVWRLIRAIRNNHHHWDLWAAGKPSNPQRHDINALAALMGIAVSDPLIPSVHRRSRPTSHTRRCTHSP